MLEAEDEKMGRSHAGHQDERGQHDDQGDDIIDKDALLGESPEQVFLYRFFDPSDLGTPTRNKNKAVQQQNSPPQPLRRRRRASRANNAAAAATAAEGPLPSSILQYHLVKDEPLPPLAWWRQLRAMITLLLFFGPLELVPPVSITLAIMLILRWHLEVVVPVALVFVLLAIFPRERHAWPRLIRHFPVWKWWIEYHGYRSFYEVPLEVIDTSKQTDDPRRRMYLEFPHGIFPLASMINQTLFPPRLKYGLRYCKAVGAGVLFHSPWFRQVFTWMGCVPATIPEMTQQLTTYDIAITPGGIAECLLSRASGDVCHVFVRSRKGVFRLALQQGCDIVPTFSFGQRQILDRVRLPYNALLHLSRLIRATIMIFYGRFCLPIPKRVRLTKVHGAPIHVPKTPMPTDEEIQALKERFIKALVELHHRYRRVAGFPNETLTIL